MYETPKDFSRVSFSIECRSLTVGSLRNVLQPMQHVIVIINNKYFTIDKTNYGISDKKRPKMGLFFSYMPKRDLKLLVSPLSIRGMSL